MSFAKMTVPVTGAAHDKIALQTAFQAAKPFNAHIEALFAWPDPREAVPMLGEPLPGEVIDSIIEGQIQAAAAAARIAHETLAAVAKSEGGRITETPTRAETVTCSFRRETGRLAPVLMEAAKLTDLIVFGPVDWASSVELGEAFLDVLTLGGKPILVSPTMPPRCVARHVTIAWDGSRTAVRAVAAAMPFLCRAETTDILTVGENADVPQLMELLALHEVASRKHVLKRDGRGAGEILLEKAVRCDTDLLVMGGYGHSHLRETFFGGVTSYVLAHAAMPVFLMH